MITHKQSGKDGGNIVELIYPSSDTDPCQLEIVGEKTEGEGEPKHNL